MATFLQLCNNVARESGTFPDVPALSTTSGVTGRSLRLTSWVADAYEEIQLTRTDWLFLEGGFSGSTVASTQNYAASALGISERFERWITAGSQGEATLSIYKTADGQGTERYVDHISWSDFRNRFMIGDYATKTGHPTFYAVNPSREIVFYPIPDAVYTVRGRYYKSPQILSEDSHTPEMPESYHRAIQFRALILLGIFDEATVQLPSWDMHYRKLMSRLVADQTPRYSKPGALA